MDPKTLSMLQMMMNQPNSQGVQGNPMGMGQQQAPQPQMMPSMGHSHGSTNPLDIGANSARRSADHTFQMNDDQRRRAMGRAIMAFSSHMARPKMEGEYIPGTAGLLASVNASFNPALEAYQNEEAQAHQLNDYAMKQQIQAQKQLQQNNLKLMEFQALQEYRNKNLENQKAALGIRKNKSLGIGGNAATYVTLPSGNHLDVSDYPVIETAAQKNLYTKDYKNNSDVYRRLEKIDKNLHKLKTESKDNIFSPTGSVLGKSPNVIKDFLARAGNATFPENKSFKSLNRESILRQNLVSEFAELQPILERAGKGGAPDAQLMKRFHELKVYLDERQPINVIESRLQELKHKIKENRDIAGLSLKAKRQFEDLPEELEEEKQSEQKVELITPEVSAKIQQLKLEKPELNKFSDQDILDVMMEKE